MTRRRLRYQPEGFSLIELLLALLVTTAVLGVVLGLLPAAAASFDTQLEASDVQQRLRVAVSTLERRLSSAGAGPYHGDAVASLADSLAAVLPYRWGVVRPDPPGTYRADTVTVRFVPEAAAETAVVRRLPPAGPAQVIETAAGCGGVRSDPGCGFVEGMRVVLLRPGGVWEIGTIAAIDGTAMHITGTAPLSADYDSGDAVVAQLEAHTYSLKGDERAGTFQLMHYDGVETDLPVVDDVIKLQFRYVGEARPPELLPGADVSAAGPWTTYGPRPPAIGSPSGSSWPDGENCAFAVVSGTHTPRLPPLPADGSGLTVLPAAAFADGPWCPDPASASRYDADLLRVRRVEVTLRVQAAGASFRGPASALFMRGGTARTSRYVPDLEVTFAVSPRSLGLER